MPISQNEILKYEGRVQARKSSEVIKEAKLARKQTAFLCHSHQDAKLAKNVQALLQDNGWEVYIDWDDHTMPERPNRETALKIQGSIRDLNWFLFLATQNSVSSRWCPWEIGYADGVKPYDSILVIPTTNYQGTYGNEYMQLYRRIDISEVGRFAVFKPDGSGIWLNTM